jgi:peptidoglycan/LPS O-acetylase OafA/YrhL
MKKFKYIDAIRGIAVLGVLMVHCGIGDDTSGFLVNFIGNGARGVQLFFVASSLTLFLSFENRKLGEKYYYINFFIRRFFRIAPMYYLGLIFYGIFVLHYSFGVQYWLGTSKNLTFVNFFANIFFVHGFNPDWINSLVPGGWSIAVEMTFYLLVPLFFKYIKNLNQALLFFMFSVILKYVLQVFLFKLNLVSDTEILTLYLNLYFPSQLPVFACGIFLYFLIKTPQNNWYISTSSLFFFTMMFLFQLTTGFILFTEHIVFSIAFVFLCYSLYLREFFILVNPITVYIGKISFSMYLSHFAILNFMYDFNFDVIQKYLGLNFEILQFLLRFIFLTVVSIIVSSIFYSFIELPFQNLGKKIIIYISRF